jgi:tetratricopeptide (TPR) repeat protein
MSVVWPWEKSPWLWLLAAACLVSFANGLTGGFTYDDKAIVRDDARIQSVEKLPEIFTTHYFGGTLATGTAYRPVDLLSFAANFAIHGKHTFGYHLVNVALHTANTILLFLLFRRRFGSDVAGGAALLFAVLPVHVEAVTSIVGRAEVLSAFFLLTAFLAAERAFQNRRSAPYLAAVALSLLANFTKESAAVFPALFFLWSMLSERGNILLKAWRLLRSRFAFFAGLSVPLLATFAVRRLVLKGFLISKQAGIFELENPLVSASPLARAGNACAILLRGVGRTMFPLYLSGDESAWQLPVLPVRSFLFWGSAMAVALLVAGAILNFSRRPEAFGILFFLLAALPTANLLFVTGTIMAERLLYLPSAGLVLVSASLLLGEALPLKRRKAGFRILTGAVLLFSARTIIRNTVWESDESLFSNLIETSPRSAKAHYDFAYMSADKKRTLPAYQHYRRATEIYKNYYDAWAGRGRLAGDLGDLSETMADARKAVEIFPTYENGWYTLAFGAERRGDFSAAEEAFRTGLKNCPSSYPLTYHQAVFLWRRGRVEEAIAAYKKAEDLAPDSAVNEEDLGRIYAFRGRTEDAEEEWDAALEEFNTDGVALGGLASIAEAREDFEEAGRQRLALYEASWERSDLLLLLDDAAKAPAIARLVQARWGKWTKRRPDLAGDPEVEKRHRLLSQ